MVGRKKLVLSFSFILWVILMSNLASADMVPILYPLGQSYGWNWNKTSGNAWGVGEHEDFPQQMTRAIHTYLQIDETIDASQLGLYFVGYGNSGQNLNMFGDIYLTEIKQTFDYTDPQDYDYREKLLAADVDISGKLSGFQGWKWIDIQQTTIKPSTLYLVSFIVNTTYLGTNPATTDTINLATMTKAPLGPNDPTQTDIFPDGKRSQIAQVFNNGGKRFFYPFAISLVGTNAEDIQQPPKINILEKLNLIIIKIINTIRGWICFNFGIWCSAEIPCTTGDACNLSTGEMRNFIDSCIPEGWVAEEKCCPLPSEWSGCTNSIQSRTTYVPDPNLKLAGRLQCGALVETRECVGGQSGLSGWNEISSNIIVCPSSFIYCVVGEFCSKADCFEPTWCDMIRNEGGVCDDVGEGYIQQFNPGSYTSQFSGAFDVINGMSATSKPCQNKVCYWKGIE